MAIKFLEDHLLAESCLKLFQYSKFEVNSPDYLSEFMILDSQAIEHLELVELGVK